ncbi:hypothetical protein D5086_029352 [Populus alba]|uniref:Uncharacterized protein n=1 Tax=Populus alba TaxID=43335 RepID=A0ACC4ATD0_POPAL
MGLRGGDRFIAGWFKLLLRGLWHEEIGSVAKWLGWICDWNKVVGRCARLVAVASGYERKERQLVLIVRKVAVDGDWEKMRSRLEFCDGRGNIVIMVWPESGERKGGGRD